MTLETDSQERKETPVYSGFLAYFPDAVKAVAAHSFWANEKHNPGEELHWSKDKSPDHADCIARHILEHGTLDPETGKSHSIALAWRAMALLQIEIEEDREFVRKYPLSINNEQDAEVDSAAVRSTN